MDLTIVRAIKLSATIKIIDYTINLLVMEMNMFASGNEQDKLKKELIDKINQLKPKASTYSELITSFQKKLASVNSSDDFSALVQDIVNKGNELNQAIFGSTSSINEKTRTEIYAYLEKDKKLTPILNLLFYPNTFHDEFIVTRERLNDKELESKLTKDQVAAVHQCINDIKALKPTADLLEGQMNVYRKRLEQCDSLDDLEDIEAEITILDSGIQKVYESMIAFPKDEDTAGKVIDYLETTPHLQLIMKRFNVLESLRDDILNNTARLHNSLGLG
jgi:uncharacterized coiled-coil DUF342 family protein